MDVVFYEAFEEEEKEIKRILPENIRAKFTFKTIQEDGKAPPAELISIRTQSRIPAQWSKSVKGILTRSQGYDHLLRFHREVQAETSYGYLGSYCARAVAEQAALMMMALLRKMKKQIKNFDTFSRDGITGVECKGRNALVVGVGNIGKEIVDIAKGLGMVVKGVDIAPSLADVDYVSLPEGMAWADVAFCALPLTGQTGGMFDHQAFENIKPGMIFINIARGEISPCEGLKSLLDEDKLGGIGLDVYSEEDLLADSLRASGEPQAPMVTDILDLSKRENVYFTPHNAFNTKEALAQKAVLTVEAVSSFLKSKTFPCPVPLP